MTELRNGGKFVYQPKCDWEDQRKEGGIEGGESPNGNQ